MNISETKIKKKCPFIANIKSPRNFWSYSKNKTAEANLDYFLQALFKTSYNWIIPGGCSLSSDLIWRLGSRGLWGITWAAIPWGEWRPESSMEHFLKLCFVTLLIWTSGTLLLVRFLAVDGLEATKCMKQENMIDILVFRIIYFFFNVDTI